MNRNVGLMEFRRNISRLKGFYNRNSRHRTCWLWESQNDQIRKVGSRMRNKTRRFRLWRNCIASKSEDKQSEQDYGIMNYSVLVSPIAGTPERQITITELNNETFLKKQMIDRWAFPMPPAIKSTDLEAADLGCGTWRLLT